MAQKIRLQVALAQLGFASRRGAVEIIKAGRVKVNARAIVQPGARVDMQNDTITVDNKNSYIQKKVYFILHKPKGVTSTVKDKFAPKTVLDLIPHKEARIFPVGRLDTVTTGLLFLTNDGELAYRLSHPKFGMSRVYRVCVQGEICPRDLQRLAAGILLEGKKTFPCKIKVIAQTKFATRLEAQLTEGRKRQIKKMFSIFGHPVLSIKRIAFGPLQLADLKVGQWRRLKGREIRQLKKVTGFYD